MTKILILKISIFILLININNKSFAQWQTIWGAVPNPILPELLSVYFVDYNNGMVAGVSSSLSKGIIIRTMDSGLTWDTVFLGGSSFRQITFSNDSTAFAAGFSMISRTKDFGNSWDTTLTSSLYSISFPSDSIGFAVGWGGVILKTTDAGNNWIAQNSMVSDHLYSVFFLNDTVGFACSDTIILKTVDGGSSWSKTVIGNNLSWYQKIFFPSDSIGYYMKSFFSAASFLYKTIDGGVNWNLQYTLPSNIQHTSMFFTNDTTGYIMGWFSMIKTTDGGITWNYQSAYPISFGNEMQDVFFLNNDTGFAVGPAYFYKTTNGGECVIPADFSFTDSISTVYFYDSTFNSTGWYWEFGDGDTSMQQNPVHTYNNAGIYNVCLTAASICDTVTICDSINVITSDIPNNNLSRSIGIEIYPNPFSSTTTIEYYLTRGTKNVEILIFNLLGMVVKKYSLKTERNILTISAGDLTAGAYFCTLISDNQLVWKRKIVVVN